MFSRIVNALGTGGALEAAADAILGIGPTQNTLAAVAQLPENDSVTALSDELDLQPTSTKPKIIGQQNTPKDVEHRDWFTRTLWCPAQKDKALLCVEHLGMIMPVVM